MQEAIPSQGLEDFFPASPALPRATLILAVDAPAHPQREVSDHPNRPAHLPAVSAAREVGNPREETLPVTREDAIRLETPGAMPGETRLGMRAAARRQPRRATGEMRWAADGIPLEAWIMAGVRKRLAATPAMRDPADSGIRLGVCDPPARERGALPLMFRDGRHSEGTTRQDHTRAARAGNSHRIASRPIFRNARTTPRTHHFLPAVRFQISAVRASATRALAAPVMEIQASAMRAFPDRSSSPICQSSRIYFSEDCFASARRFWVARPSWERTCWRPQPARLFPRSSPVEIAKAVFPEAMRDMVRADTARVLDLMPGWLDQLAAQA